MQKDTYQKLIKYMTEHMIKYVNSHNIKDHPINGFVITAKLINGQTPTIKTINPENTVNDMIEKLEEFKTLEDSYQQDYVFCDRFYNIYFGVEDIASLHWKTDFNPLAKDLYL